MSEKIWYEPMPITRERKQELRAQGYRILDAAFAPIDWRPPGAEPVVETAPIVVETATDGPSDQELREAIKAATGKYPHWKSNRASLLEQYEATKA